MVRATPHGLCPQTDTRGYPLAQSAHHQPHTHLIPPFLQNPPFGTVGAWAGGLGRARPPEWLKKGTADSAEQQECSSCCRELAGRFLQSQTWVFYLSPRSPSPGCSPGKRKPGPTQPLALNIYGRRVQGHPKLEVTQTPLVVPVIFPKSGMAISGRGGQATAVQHPEASLMEGCTVWLHFRDTLGKATLEMGDWWPVCESRGARESWKW